MGVNGRRSLLIRGRGGEDEDERTTSLGPLHKQPGSKSVVLRCAGVEEKVRCSGMGEGVSGFTQAEVVKGLR